MCLQPSPAAEATNQIRCPDSSRLVRFKDSSLVRNGSPSGWEDFESRCARDLMSSLVSQVLPGEPFMSRQQVSLVNTVTHETDAMEKGEKLDGGQFLSPGCRPQLGYQRASGRLSLGTGSKQRRVRRRRRAVSARFHCPYQVHPSGGIS